MKRNTHITANLKRAFVDRYVGLFGSNLAYWQHKSLDDIFDTFAAHIYTRQAEGPHQINHPQVAERAKRIAIKQSKIVAKLSTELRHLGYQPSPGILERVNKALLAKTKM